MATTSPPPKLQGKNENHAAWLLRRIWDRVNTKDEHFMGVIVGQEGSGKSYTAIRIASEVDPTFTADRVIFEVSDLLKRLRNDEHEPGNFYVLDEAGVQLGRRTWQERSQVLANQALQLIRDHNLGLVFTLPRLGEFDSQAQGRLQAALELIEKEPDEWVRGKWKWFDPDRMDETGTIYKKFPRRRVDGQLLRVTTLAFQPPDPQFIEDYQRNKREFQNEFYDRVIHELDDIEVDEDEEESMGLKEIADELASNGMADVISESKRDGSYYVNWNLIRTEYDLSQADAQAVKALLEKQFDPPELEAMVR